MEIKDKIILRLNNLLKEYKEAEEIVKTTMSGNKMEAISKDRVQKLQVGTVVLKATLVGNNFKLLCDILKEDLGEDLSQILDNESYKIYEVINQAVVNSSKIKDSQVEFSQEIKDFLDKVKNN